MSTDMYALVCNYSAPTAVASKGARAYVAPQLGGNLPDRLRIVVRSRGGRWVQKWEATRRLENFRIKTIPPEHPHYERFQSRFYVLIGRSHASRAVDLLLKAKAEVKPPARVIDGDIVS